MEVSDKVHNLVLYPQGERPQHQMDRKVGGPQSQSECSGKEKKIPSLPLPGMKPQLSSP